jgi:hypothetical protein
MVFVYIGFSCPVPLLFVFVYTIHITNQIKKKSNMSQLYTEVTFSDAEDPLLCFNSTSKDNRMVVWHGSLEYGHLICLSLDRKDCFVHTWDFAQFCPGVCNTTFSGGMVKDASLVYHVGDSQSWAMFSRLSPCPTDSSSSSISMATIATVLAVLFSAFGLFLICIWCYENRMKREFVQHTHRIAQSQDQHQNATVV